MLIAALLAVQANLAGAPTHHCVGESLSSCVALIQSRMILDEPNIEGQLKDLDRVDVNGRKIAQHRPIVLMASLPGEGTINSRLITIELTPGNIVKSLGVSLSTDPAQANTEAEYDATRLFEMASLVLDPSCTGGKLGLYRTFQNSVKPKIVRGAKETRITEIHAETNRFDKAPPVTICGVQMTYSKLFSVDTENVSLDNPHGISGLVTLDFD